MPCGKLTIQEFNNLPSNAVGYADEFDCLDATVCNPALQWFNRQEIVEGNNNLNGCRWPFDGNPPYGSSASMTERTINIPLNVSITGQYPYNNLGGIVPTGSYEMRVLAYASSHNNRGPGCTRYKFRTSITGATVHEIDGCCAGCGSNQSTVWVDVRGCKTSDQNSVTIEIFDYFRGWTIYPDYWQAPYEECPGGHGPGVPGWGFYLQAWSCPCP